MPIISLDLFLFFILILKIDCLEENIKKFGKYFDGFVILIIAFLLTIFWNIELKFNIGQVMIPVLGFLFVIAAF